MTTKKLSTGYVPRDWQADLHNRLKQQNIVVFHRRGGKTVFAVNEIIDKAIRFNKMCPKTGQPLKNPQFAFVAPTIGQVEKIAWQYFKDYLSSVPDVKFNETKKTIKFPHPRGTCTIYLFGAENFDTIRGIYLDGYVLDEYADMHPDVRDKVFLPMLSDRDGWEMVIGTPKGENAFKALYDEALSNPEEWTHCLCRASETGILAEEVLAKLKRTMSDEAYRQEYECDFNAAPSGKYYQRYIDDARAAGRICRGTYDPSAMVSTFWDIGHGDSTAIWFVQEVGREIRVVRYIEDHGKGLEYYVQELERLPYHYNEHVFPHDLEHHELSSGRTRRQYLVDHGLDDNSIVVVPKSMNVNEDIHVVRTVIPKCWFDSVNCFEGLKALSGYERKWDSKEKVYKDKPNHNWASHGADAFRTFAVYYEPGFGKSFRNRGQHLLRVADSEYNILDF